MDKYDLVLDIIEHPEKYQSVQLEEILSDPETREIYNLLCKTDSVIKSRREADIESEWEEFESKHIRKTRRLHFIGNRAASIAIFAVSSVVAVAISVAVTMSVISNITNHSDRDNKIVVTEDSIGSHHTAIANAPQSASSTPIMFEDATLETIMNTIAENYGVAIHFINKDAAALHLYYRLDSSLSLEEIISQLNTFDQIKITLNDNTLTID